MVVQLNRCVWLVVWAPGSCARLRTAHHRRRPEDGLPSLTSRCSKQHPFGIERRNVQHRRQRAAATPRACSRILNRDRRRPTRVAGVDRSDARDLNCANVGFPLRQRQKNALVQKGLHGGSNYEASLGLIGLVGPQRLSGKSTRVTLVSVSASILSSSSTRSRAARSWSTAVTFRSRVGDRLSAGTSHRVSRRPFRCFGRFRKPRIRKPRGFADRDRGPAATSAGRGAVITSGWPTATTSLFVCARAGAFRRAAAAVSSPAALVDRPRILILDEATSKRRQTERSANSEALDNLVQCRPNDLHRRPHTLSNPWPMPIAGVGWRTRKSCRSSVGWVGVVCLFLFFFFVFFLFFFYVFWLLFLLCGYFV